MLKKTNFNKRNNNYSFLNVKKVISIIVILCLSLTIFSGSKIEKLLGQVLFYTDSDEMKEESLPVLEKIAVELVKNKDLLIKLEGHTNSIGEPDNEYELSVNRAKKIASFLESKGIDNSRIEFAGFGGKKLKENRIVEINRRVEIISITLKEDGTTNTANKVVPEKISSNKRILDIKVLSNENRIIPADLEIKKRENENVVFSQKYSMEKQGQIEMPDGDKIEVLISSKGYIPKKIYIEEKDSIIYKTVVLDMIEKGKTFVVDNIYFNINKAILKFESFDIIDEIVDLMKENPDLRIEVMGHTDNTGKRSTNIKLSENRAKTVANYLIKKGITSDRLISKGFGDTQPVASNRTEEGRKKNRRTEFSFF